MSKPVLSTLRRRITQGSVSLLPGGPAMTTGLRKVEVKGTRTQLLLTGISPISMFRVAAWGLAWTVMVVEIKP